MSTIVHIPAGRNVRANFLARRSLHQSVSTLREKSPCEWPEDLAKAWDILCTELDLSEAEARDVMIQSATIAQHCAAAQNQQSINVVRTRAPVAIKRACKKISNCIKRTPASLRKELDQAIISATLNSVVDLELIESVFETTEKIFKKYPDIKPSATALKALAQLSAVNFSALELTSRRNAEQAFADLLRREKKVTAARIFQVLMQAIGEATISTASPSSFGFITSYVFDLMVIWRRMRLPTGRARNDASPQYKSKFHRFADLVLTALCEPQARRHNADLESIRQQAWLVHARLSTEDKKLISASLPRADRQWMVSEAHIKAALRGSQISGLKSP